MYILSTPSLQTLCKSSLFLNLSFSLCQDVTRFAPQPSLPFGRNDMKATLTPLRAWKSLTFSIFSPNMLFLLLPECALSLFGLDLSQRPESCTELSVLYSQKSVDFFPVAILALHNSNSMLETLKCIPSVTHAETALKENAA